GAGGGKGGGGEGGGKGEGARRAGGVAGGAGPGARLGGGDADGKDTRNRRDRNRQQIDRTLHDPVDQIADRSAAPLHPARDQRRAPGLELGPDDAAARGGRDRGHGESGAGRQAGGREDRHDRRVSRRVVCRL